MLESGKAGADIVQAVGIEGDAEDTLAFTGLGADLAPGIGQQAVAEVLNTGLGVHAALADGGYVALVLDGPRPQEHLPVGQARAGGEGGRAESQIHWAPGAEQLGKA